MDRVIKVLKQFQEIIKHYPNVEKVVVCATSAVRDASNRLIRSFFFLLFLSSRLLIYFVNSLGTVQTRIY
jgi:hypothetical protein